MSDHYRRLERMYHGAPINSIYVPVMQISEGVAELTMPAKPELFHAAHALHGSVYFKVMDDTAFFAVSSIVDDVFVLTSSFNVYLLRPVTGGTLRAVGRVVHRTKNVFIAESEVFDDQQRLVGRGSGSFMRSKIPLDERVGYV